MRETQNRLILQPLLTESIGAGIDLGSQLQQWLRSSNGDIYGAGNLIDLAISAEISLQGWNLSGLNITEVDFQGLELQRVDFRGSRFDRCRFSTGMGAAIDVSFSEDGTLLAVSDTCGRIKVWEVASNREIAMLVGHQSWVWHSQFSPNNRYLISGSADNSLRIWDITTGECLQILEGHRDWVWRVGFALDNNLAVSIGADRVIKVWWWRKRLQILSFVTPELGLRDGIFHAGRSLLAFCSDRGIRVWHLWTGRVICEITTEPACNLRKLTFSNDGRQIFGASLQSCEIYSWRLADGAPQLTLVGHRSQIAEICCNDVGELVSICMERIRVWQIDTGKCLRAIDLAPKSSGKAATYRYPLVAAGSDNGMVKIWNLETGQCLSTAGCSNSRVMGLAASGNLVASSTDRGLLQLWDFSSLPPQPLWSHTGHPSITGALTFSPDGRQLASSDGNRSISIWDLEQHKLSHFLTGHTDYVRQTLFLDDRTLLSRSYDTTIRCWDLDSGSSQSLDFLKSQWLLGMASSDDRQWVAFGTAAPQLILWHRSSGKIHTAKPHGNRLNLLAFSPDRQWVVGVTFDRFLNCWRLENLHDCHYYYLGDREVSALHFHPANSDWLLIGWDDGSIALWDLGERRSRHRFRAHESEITAIQVLAPAPYLLTSSLDGSMRVWELVGEEFRQLWSIDLPQPYQGMQLDRVSGLTRSQSVTLQQLGANG